MKCRMFKKKIEMIHDKINSKQLKSTPSLFWEFFLYNSMKYEKEMQSQ